MLVSFCFSHCSDEGIATKNIEQQRQWREVVVFNSIDQCESLLFNSNDFKYFYLRKVSITLVK